MQQVTFTAVDDFGFTEVGTSAVNMVCQAESWNEIADTFFHFLLAQGYIVSETDLAHYFADKADEMKDLRSNIRPPKNPRSEAFEAFEAFEDGAVAELVDIENTSWKETLRKHGIDLRWCMSEECND